MLIKKLFLGGQGIGAYLPGLPMVGFKYLKTNKLIVNFIELKRKNWRILKEEKLKYSTILYRLIYLLPPDREVCI
jgi:hypothetical protein